MSVHQAPQRRRGSVTRHFERFATWLLTGPIGRLAAFFADLGVYWWRWASGREANARER
jgi:hypothetical protein